MTPARPATGWTDRPRAAPSRGELPVPPPAVHEESTLRPPRVALGAPTLVQVSRRLLTRALAAASLALAGYAALSAATASVAAADGPAGLPEVGECEATPELVPGATGADVRCLQYALIMQGFDVAYTGTFDTATTDAVRSYQRAHPPLRVDGRAGEQTLAALGIRIGDADDPPPPDATALDTSDDGSTEQRDEAFVELPTSSLTCLADAHLKVGSTGTSVTCLQKRLAELGMYRGTASGSFDRALSDAVREFQAIRPPLDVDGVAGPRTLAALGIWSGISPGALAPSQVTTSVIGTGSFPAGPSTEPQWNLTADGIPYYGNRTPCTAQQAALIAYEFARDGADVATQQWAVYIASREGGCRYDAVNVNAATRDDSHCTFQINALAGVFGPTAELGRRGWTVANIKASLQACADAASDLWVYCGRGPWTPPYSCRPPWGASMSTANVPAASEPAATTTTAAPVSTATTSAPLPTSTSPPTPTLPVATSPATTPATTPATSPGTSPAPGTTVPADGP